MWSNRNKINAFNIFISFLAFHIHRDYGHFVANEETLIRMKEGDVFIINNRETFPSQPIRYFKNRMKDIFIYMCKECNKFFRTEEWENAIAKNEKMCPVCNCSSS